MHARACVRECALGSPDDCLLNDETRVCLYTKRTVLVLLVGANAPAFGEASFNVSSYIPRRNCWTAESVLRCGVKYSTR